MDIEIWFQKGTQKNLGQYDRFRVLGCEPVDGILVVLNSNQKHIVTFVHQIEYTPICKHCIYSWVQMRFLKSSFCMNINTCYDMWKCKVINE